MGRYGLTINIIYLRQGPLSSNPYFILLLINIGFHTRPKGIK